MSAPLQIFKPGRHVAMSGAAIEFSTADLAATAAAYDPAKHEAPIVVGHPRIDAPAYGWVAKLSAAAGLEAVPHQVDPAFAEMVAAGRFKKISASFFTPDSPANPVPGVYYLRHVGFLGAQPPAVKGLRNPEFAEDETGIVEFGDWGDRQNASLRRRLRDFFIAQFGLEKADSVIPDYAVETLEDAAREPATESATESATGTPAAFADSPTPETTVTLEEKAAVEAENARLKQQIAETAARDKTIAAAARHTVHAAFADTLVTAGTLLPAQRDVCVATLDFVAGQESVVEFGEGDAKQPLAEAFKTFLQKLPKQVEFGEISGAKDEAGTLAFAAPPGHSVDAGALDLHHRAQAHARAHNLSYDDALRAVQAR